MKKRFLLVIMLALGILASEGMATRSVVVVKTPPPPPRSVRVVGRRPARGFVWTGGYYRWRGGPRHRGYAWVPGRWVRPPRRGAVWVSPRWRRSRGGYTFVAGRWR